MEVNQSQLQLRMHFQMKQEILPDIPQTHSPNTFNVRATMPQESKWFTRSHKCIFDPHRSKHHSSIQQNEMNDSQRVIPFELQPERELQTSEKSKIINLMREQIEINCQLYVTKMGKLLQDQAKYSSEYLERSKFWEISSQKNQIQLNSKNHLIQQMSLRIAQMQKKGLNKCQVEGSLEKIEEKRVLQLEQGLKEIAKILKVKISDKVTKVENQLKDISGKLSKRVYTTIQQMRQGISQRMDRVQKILQMNSNSSLAVTGSISRSKSAKNDWVQKRNMVLSQEIQDLKQEIQHFKRKKFKYDNYKFQEAQSKIQSLELKVKSLENKADKTSSKISNNANLALKSSQTTHLTRTEAPQDCTSSNSRFINKYKSLINNRKQRQQVSSSKSFSESEVQQTMVQDEENIERFLRLVNEARLKTPINVQIDQTGYLKSTDTGMYLVDSLGDGFEFSSTQLERLKQRGVICL